MLLFLIDSHKEPELKNINIQWGNKFFSWLYISLEDEHLHQQQNSEFHF